MKNDFKISNIIFMTIINSILILVFIINKFHWINISFIILYGIIFYFFSDNKKILTWIIMFLLIDFLTQNLWYATHYEFNTYIIYIKLSIIISTMVSIVTKFSKYINCFKDKIIWLQIFFLILGTIRFVDTNYTISELINGLYVYLGPVLIYILISNNKFRYKDIYKMIFYLQGPLVVFEYIIYRDQDQISGIFGLYGITTAMLFLSISIYWLFFKVLKREENLNKIICCLVYCFLIFVLSEVKMAFALIPITMLTIIFFTKGKVFKKIMTILLLFVIIIIGMNSIISLYPEFKEIIFNFDNLKKYAIESPVGKYKYSRVECFEFINNNINESNYDKLLGRGMGNAIRNKNFVYKLYSRGRDYVDIDDSRYYQQYEYTGYTTTSLNILYIESGIIGILLYSVTIIILLKRAYYLFKMTNNMEYMAIGITYICFIELWLGIFWYANMLYNTSATLIFWIFSGIVSISYRESINKKIII